MKKHNKGEMWHLNKILDCIQTPKTQDQIVKASNLNNFTLKKFLKRLQKLKFVEKIKHSEKRSITKKGIHHTSAIVWKITPKGNEFNKIISEYVSLGFNLK